MASANSTEQGATTMTQLTALAALQALAASAAEVSAVDITETSTGGGERQLLETGKYLARMVEYVEYGLQKNVFEPAKAPRPVARVGFAVFPFEDVEGVRKVSSNPVFLRSFDLTVSNHEKAGLKKLYNRLNYRKDAAKSHVATFLGEPFMVGVIKYLPQKPKSPEDFRNKLDLNDISPAIDVMTGAPYPVPAVEDNVYRAFFWDLPTQATWEALHIEGSYDDGKSKNFIQDTILGAVDFPGSALEQLLTGASSLPTPDSVAPVEAVQEAAALVPMMEAAVPVVPEADNLVPAVPTP